MLRALEAGAIGRTLARIRLVGICRKFLFIADGNEFVQRRCFGLRVQQMAVLLNDAPRLDRTLLMQRCDHAVDNAMELPGQAP
ncbi:hypothetical protein JQ594_12915 [Bradyrhizobium manausense]|nr:hypothetical protein [Bradyrhizobium manausense]